MRVPRVYSPEPLANGQHLKLADDAANHIARVLRLRQGAPLVLFNGTGGEFAAEIVEIGKRDVLVRVCEYHGRESESPLTITLVQAISRGERMDYTIQKAVELGVTRIVPVLSARSVVSLDDERRGRRLEHWRKVVASACEQCGRNRLPEMAEPMALSAWLRTPPEGLGLVLDPGAETSVSNLAAATGMSLMVGPEGGFAPEEIAAAHKVGYRGLRLGPRVLRTETAAVVALAAIQARWGDLA